MLLNGQKTNVHFCILAVTFVQFFCCTLNAQEHLKDSLEQRRRYYESQGNFQPNDTNYLKTLYLLARSYAYQNYDSVLSVGQRAIDLSLNYKFEQGVAGGYLALATGATLQGEFEKGMTYAKKSENLALAASSDSLELAALNVQCMNYLKRGDFPKGYMVGKTGAIKAKEYDISKMEFIFTINLATGFLLLKDTENALNYYEQGLKLLESTTDSIGLAQIKSNLSYLQNKKGNYTLAENYGIQAFDYLKKKGINAWAAFAIVNAGEACIKRNDITQAKHYLNLAEELLETIDDKQREVEKDLAYAEIYLLENDLGKSKAKAVLGEKNSKSINYYDGIIRASNLLYQINKKENNNDLALTYLETATRISDSIKVEASKTQLLVLEAQTEFEQQQRRLELTSQNKLKKQKLITTVSVLSLIVLIAILLLIRRNIQIQKKANARLKEISRTKDQVFSIVGHDLKAPIGTLQELLSLYQSDKLSTEQFLKIAPKLKSNVDHSAFTLNNLLFWAQQQLNGIKSRPESVTLKTAGNNVVALHQEQIDKKNIAIECKIPTDAKVVIDPEHLNIILRNIISNAIKYTHENGKIIFSYHQGNQPSLTVCDDGVGMSIATIEKIINGRPISKPGTSKEKGTGIGLNICKELLKLNHGNLKINSTLGKGTCIEIIFSSP
ncbi:Integral membrane sensor signal transduction histidine kinase [Croceitalea dokdonensis DOKDO 023]|uniref:histidine kinase n=1 Tax=Croceitalea dokdonensis DOKDO 023 TaxID=1300341 RepID=A0A0P7B3Q9_9FLAO|nr:Integral membrane sensor signal transduction histidine kinase [Croceitalea dokdonensis DOKDO 023]